MANDKGNNRLNVEVAYARPDQQFLVSVEVPEGSTLLAVVQLSGVLARFPEIDVATAAFGVFGRREKDPATRRVQAGDRVEIYRPLLIDPKEARKARADKARARREAESKASR